MTQPIDPLLDPSSSFGQASSPEPSIDPRVPNPTAPAIDPRVPQPTPASPAQLKAMRRAKVHGLKPVPIQPAPQAAPAPQPVPQQPVAGMPQPAPPSPIEQKARRAAYAISPSAAAVRADDPNMARLMDVQQAMFNPPPRQQAPWMGYGGGDVQKAMDEAWARKRQERIGAASPEEQAVLQQIRDLERPSSFTRMPETPKLPTTGEEIVAPLDVDEASADPIAYLKDRKSEYSQIENPLLREAALSYLDAATPHVLGVPREQAEALARQYNRGKKLEYSDPAARAFREKAYAHLYEQDNLPDEERYEGPLTDKSESEKSLERRIEKEGKGTWGGLEARRQKLESFSRKREAIAQAEAAGALDLNRYIREELTPHFPRKEGETWAQWMNRLPDDVKDSVDEVTEQVAAERRRGQAAARAAARQASIEGAEQKYLPEIFVDAAARTLVTWGAGVARLAGAAGSDTGEQIADAMSEWGQEEELAPSQSEMMSLLEKKNFSQWLGKLTGIAGEQAPNIAMALVGGGAGGALGKALNVSSKLAKGMQLVGGTLTIAPLEFESQFDESFMHNLAQGMGNEDAASAAMLEAGGYAVLASAFEAMPYAKFMGRGFPKRALGERSWRKIVRDTVKQAGEEFGTEGMQATTSQLVRRFASDILGIEKPPMDWVAIAEEALTGAIFGFGVGGVTSVASEAAKQPVRDKTFARALDVVRSGRGLTVDTLSEEGRVQDIEGAVADPVNLGIRQAAAEEGMASFTKKQRQQLIDAQARLGDAPKGSPEWMSEGVAAARANMTAEQKEAAATAAREEYAEIGPVQFGTGEVVEVEASATEKSVLSRKNKMSKAEQDSAFQSIEDGVNKNRKPGQRVKIKRADKLTKADRVIKRIGEALGFQTLMYDATTEDGRRTTMVAGMHFKPTSEKQKRTIALQTGQSPLAGTATALHEVIGHGIRASGKSGAELYDAVLDSIVAMGESRPEAQRLVERAQKRYAQKAEAAKDGRDEIKLMEEAMGDIAIELASRILGTERASALQSLADADEPTIMARVADFFKSLLTSLGLRDGIKARTAEGRERANAVLQMRNMIQTFTGDKNIVAHLRKLNQLAETERTNLMRDQADPEAADAQVQAEQDAGEAAPEAAAEPKPEAKAEPDAEVQEDVEKAAEPKDVPEQKAKDEPETQAPAPDTSAESVVSGLVDEDLNARLDRISKNGGDTSRFQAAFDKIRSGTFANRAKVALSYLYDQIRTASDADYADYQVSESDADKAGLSTNDVNARRENGWFYRGPASLLSPRGWSGKKGDAKVSANVTYSDSLLAEMDAFVLELQNEGVDAYYKVPDQAANWDTRHDPLSLYASQSLTAKQQSRLTGILSQHTRTKAATLNKLTGKKLADGVFEDANPSKSDLAAVIARAESTGHAEIADAIKAYIGNKASTGQVAAAHMLLDKVEAAKKSSGPAPDTTTSAPDTTVSDPAAELEAELEGVRNDMGYAMDAGASEAEMDALLAREADLLGRIDELRQMEPEPPIEADEAQTPAEPVSEPAAPEAQEVVEPTEAAEAVAEPQDEADTDGGGGPQVDMSLQHEYTGYDQGLYATPEQVKKAGVKAEDAKKTAISSKVEDGEAKTGTARTYQKLAKVIAPLSRVLDYGAGRAFGTQVFQEKGLDADAYEVFQHDKPGVPYRYSKPEQVPAAMYDVVVSNAVLNVVPHETRMEILREMHRALKPGGRMFINVRQWSGDVSKAAGKAERLSDTEILTTTGSFQKGFVNEAELHDMIRQALPDVTVERQEGEPWHKAVVFKPSQSPQAWADFSQQAPELISAADVKLGDPKVALALLEKHGLVSPDHVRALLGDKQPEYLDKVVEFMVKQREKVKAGKLKPRDLAKAYIITVASQGSNSIKASTIKEKVGFNVKRIFQDGRGGVRPEEAAAAWLASRKGQTALNRLDRGDYRPDDWAPMFDLRKAYGDDRLNTNNVAGEKVQVFPGNKAKKGDEILTIPIEVEPTTVTKKIDGVNTDVEVFKWNDGVKRYEIRTDAVRADRVVAVRKQGGSKLNLRHVIEMTAAINEARGDIESISKSLNKLSGIGDAKLPFIKHLLGFGDAATIDAVEINLWVTGQGDTKHLHRKDEQLDRMIKLFRKAQGKNKFQDQLFKQISDSLQTLIDSDILNASVPKEYAMHILHHWVWDRAKGDETTHAGMMEVMADSSIQQPSEPLALDRLSNDVIAQFKRSNGQFGKVKIPKAQRQEAEELGLSTTDYRVAGSILEGDLTPSRVLGVKQYLMGEPGPMETEGVNEKELVEGFRSSAAYMPQPSSDARQPLVSFSSQAPDESTINLYNESFGDSLSTKGHRKERDNVAGKRTAIHKRVKGLRAPSGYEGAPANGSDFPEAVHERNRQVHRRIKAAGRKVSQALRTRDQALAGQALVDFLRNPDAAPASVRPAISNLMKDLAVVRERDLDRKTRVLDDSSSEAEVVYYDNKSSAVYKTYDIDEGIVTHAIRPYEIVRFNAMTGDPNPYHTTHDQTPLLDFLQRIEDSNAIGRTVYTEVVGVTDMGRLLVKQPYIEGLQDLIESDGYTTKKDQTRKAIRDAGFNTFDNPKMWDAAWTRLGDDVFIGVDLHGGNVQLNGDGVPFFVDMPLRKLTEGEQRILSIPEAEAEQAADEAVSLEQYLEDPDSVEPGEMLDGTFTLPDADFSLQVAETRDFATIGTQELVGELSVLFPYDRMKTGWASYNVDGVKVKMLVHGGPDHPHTEDRQGKAGIATRGKGSATSLLNKILAVKPKYGVIVVGRHEQLIGNTDYAKLYMRVVRARVKKGLLSETDFLTEINGKRAAILNKRVKKQGKWVDAIGKTSPARPHWEAEWTSLDQIDAALNVASFDQRKEIFDARPKVKNKKFAGVRGFKDSIGSQEHIDRGFPDFSDIFEALIENDWNDLPAGTAVSAIEFGDNVRTGTAKELGFKDHPGYPYNISAIRSGRLTHTFHATDMEAQDWGGETAAERQAKLKNYIHQASNPPVRVGSNLDPSVAPAVTAIVSASIQQGSRDPLGMHSRLQRFADSLTQKKLSSDQFLGMAKKNGVKEDELHWTGTDKWLAGRKSFTLDELDQHLADNRVTLDEVTLNGPSPEWEAYAREYQEANRRFQKARRALGAAVEDVAMEFIPNGTAMSYGIAAPLAVDRAVRGFQDVSLEASALAVVNGLTNVPSRDQKVLKDALMESPEFAQVWQQYLIHNKIVNGIVSRKPKNPSTAYYGKDGLVLPGAVNYREVLLDWHGGGSRAFTAPHFADRDNLLAHLRVTDRVLDDGRKALFLEEVQSDWHQKGRDSGYASELPQLKPKELEGMGWSFTKIDEGPLKGKWALRKRTGDGNYATMGTLRTKADAVRKANTLSQVKPEDRGAVADAPFKTTWHELLLKRAITMAVDGGYDAIAWTTGETQAERSDKLLADATDRIVVTKDTSLRGTYQVHGYKGGELTFHEQQHDPESLRDLIGAKMATASIGAIKQGQDGAEFGGDDLTIGGHGMRVFYDQKLRNAAKKIGKRFKARPETGSITHPGDVKGENVQTKVHTLTLTDSMQETAATEGLAQFSVQEGDLGQNSTAELWWMSNKGLSVRRPELRPVPSFGGDPRVKRQAHQDVAEAWQGLVRGYVDHEAGAISVQGPLDNVKWPRSEVDKAARAAMRQLSIMFPDYTVHPMGEVAHGEVAADFALGPSVPDSNFSLGPETRRQAIRRYMQDKFDPIKRLQRRILESGGVVDDQTDVYLYESLFPGKTARDLDTIQRKYVAPLIRAIADSGLGMSRVDELLMARHAKERNERIRDINPEFNTRYYDKDGNPIDPGGSGMPDDVAEQIIKEAKENGDWAKAQPAMKLLDKLNQTKLKMLVRSGMLSQEAVDAMTERFPNYVPLVGHSGETLQPEIAFLSSGPMDAEGAEAVMNVSTTRMSVSETAVKRALGRTTLAESPIIASVMLANNAAVLSRRNEVAQSFLKLVHANPDPSMWEIDKRRTSYYYDKQSGEARQRDNVMQGQYMKNVVDVRVSGDLVSIYVKDPQVVRAMNNIGAAQMPGLVRLMGKAMRVYSALRTQLNPVFVPINFLRDLMTAGIHTKGEIDGAFARKTIKNAFPAMVGIYRYEKWARSEREGKDSKPPEKSLYWVEMLDRMEKAGGRVAFFGLTDFTDKKAEIEAMVKRAERGHKDHSAIQTVKAVGGLVSDLNASAENAARLAAFAEAIERGWSDAAAADLARNLTVNFNRKGEVANWMGAFYAFYNASVQGNTRMLQSVVKAKGTRKIALGITAFSAGLSLLNYMFSGEDENGVNEWAAMPSSYKARNLIIMLPGGRHVKIPLPWGYNVFHALGTNVMDTITGAQAAKAAGSQTALAVLESFNPIGTSATMTQQVMPTMFEPMVQWEQNTAWHGGPIYKEPMQPGLVPHSRRHFDSASEVSQFMAKSLNDILGGNQFKSGLIDLNPEGIDHLADALFGATGGFVADVISLARKSTGKIAGEPDIELGVRDVPWANKFYGSKREYAAERDFHNLRIAATNAESLLKAYIQSGMTKEAEALKVNKAALIEGRDKLNEVNKLQKALDTRALVLSELPASKAGRLELLESYVRQLEEKGSDELSEYYRGLSNKALRQPMADIAVAMGVDKDFAERFVTGKMHHNALLSRIEDASGGMSRAEVQAWVKELRDERTKAMKQVAGELRDALDFPARPYPEQER